MGEVSANPSVMRDYFLDGSDHVARWRPEVDRLREVLDDLRRAFTDGGVPVDYRAGFTTQTADDLAGRLEQIKEDVQHSDQYVYDVAVAVTEADGFEISTDPTGEASWPDGVLTVPESALAPVGPAARFEAAVDAAGPDAARGLELLEAEGVMAALEGGLEDEELADLALGIDSEGDLARWLEETGPKLEDPLYAAAFYNALGAEGLEGLSAVFLAAGGVADINIGAGWREDSAPGSGDWARHVADPFIEGLAEATTTGLLDLTVLFGPDPAAATFQAAGGMASGNVDLPDPDGLATGFVTENDRQAAAIMFSADGELYDPWVFGRAAQEILGAGQQYGEFPPYGDEFVTEADALMMRGLAENPAAAYYFTVDDTGEPVDAYLNMLIDPDPGLDYLADPYAGFNNEHIWLDTPEGRAGTLPEMWELWSATAYYNLIPDQVTYEFRDFHGNAIDGHPWRNPDLLLGDDRFLEGAGYDGWYDPTLGEEHSLYTIWVGPPGNELEPLGFFYDNRPEQMSQLIDIAPFVGQAKALYETFTAHDPVTGEDTNRWLALTGFVIGAGLWGAGAYMGGAPLLAWTRNRLRSNPPPIHQQSSPWMTTGSTDLGPPPSILGTPPSFPEPPSQFTPQTFNEDGALTHVFGQPVDINLENAPSYPNLLPHYKDGPQGDRALVNDTFHEIGVDYDPNYPPTPTNNSADFDLLLDASPDNRMIFTVREDGSIAFAPRTYEGEFLHHSGLTRGENENVLAAGEITLLRGEDGTYEVLKLSNQTGHFRVPPVTLHNVGIPLLEQQGFEIDLDTIQYLTG